MLTNDLAYDASLNQDTNGDGVSLLMEYALNLNPEVHNAGNLPAIQLNGATADMKFYSLSQGVSYTVYTSTDLSIWTTTGVTLSAPDGDGCVTASIPFDGPKGFMKLEVVEN